MRFDLLLDWLAGFKTQKHNHLIFKQHNITSGTQCIIPTQRFMNLGNEKATPETSAAQPKYSRPLAAQHPHSRIAHSCRQEVKLNLCSYCVIKLISLALPHKDKPPHLEPS